MIVLSFYLAVQEDGKVVIGGLFSAVNGVGRSEVARLNPDGSRDTSFGPGNDMDGFVNHLAIQADGKILVAGDFSFVNGAARRGGSDQTKRPGWPAWQDHRLARTGSRYQGEN